MAIIKKFDIQIDLTHPAEEIINVISLIIGYFPEQAEEILTTLDHSIGEALAVIKNQNNKEELGNE